MWASTTVDRTVYEPGQITQCDLWFPEPRIPVAAGQDRVLPVLVMTLGFSRFMTVTMIPTRQAGDILSGDVVTDLRAGQGDQDPGLGAVVRDRRDRAGQ